MEKEELLEVESALDNEEPHFEEEWTILAARPVVPLNEVESTWRGSQATKLILAFVGASLLGVVVALASIRFRGLGEPESDIIVPAQTGTVESARENTEAAEAPAVMPESATTRVVKTPTTAIESSKHQATPSGDSDPSNSQSRLVDEWQEQRPRRTIIRRQRREPDDLHHRDLLRIQEIFEGRRPRN